MHTTPLGPLGTISEHGPTVFGRTGKQTTEKALSFVSILVGFSLVDGEVLLLSFGTVVRPHWNRNGKMSFPTTFRLSTFSSYPGSGGVLENSINRGKR